MDRGATMHRSTPRLTISLCLLVGMVLAGGGAATAQSTAWLERSFRVELVTVSPWGSIDRGSLTVGELGIRVDGSEGDAPYVVIYRFDAGGVDMHLLDPVSSTVLTVRFPRQEPIELDLLTVASLLLPPWHGEHPCLRYAAQASCYPEARETLDGVPVERWSLTFDDGFGSAGTSFVAWVSTVDGTVLRTAYPDGYRIDFVGYAFGPQPPELFQVPPEYAAP